MKKKKRPKWYATTRKVKRVKRGNASERGSIWTRWMPTEPPPNTEIG